MIKLIESLFYVGTVILRMTPTTKTNERGYLLLTYYIDEDPEA